MLKGKFVLIVMALIILLFTTNDFGMTDIEKMAIIVAISIDKEDEEYEVCAQIAVADTSSQSTTTQKPSMLSGKGQTPVEALDNITEKSGWEPNLTFCSLILLGDSIYTADVMPTIDFVIRNRQFSDGSILACTDGKAKDFLNVHTTLDEISSFSIMKILKKDKGNSLNSNSTIVKEFAKKKHNKVDNTLTFLKRIAPTNSSNQQSQTPNQETLPKYNFMANQVVGYDDDKYVAVLSEDQTQSLNLLTKKIVDGCISLEDIETKNYYIKKLELLVNSKGAKTKLKYDKLNNIVVCDLTFKANLYVSHLESDDIKNRDQVSQDVAPEIKARFIQKMQKDFADLLAFLQEKNLDLLGIEEKLFKFKQVVYKKHFSHGEFSLADVKFNIIVQTD